MLNEREASKKIVKLIKAFIENPSAESAIGTARAVASYDLHMCGVSVDWYSHGWEGVCRKCVWKLVCHGREPKIITDEEVSAMVLDAIRIVTLYEAKNAR